MGVNSFGTQVINGEPIEITNGKGYQPLQSGKAYAFKVKAGEEYRVVRKVAGQRRLLDNVIAKRIGDDLVLIYADGTEITLEDYFIVCQDGECVAVLPGEDAAGYPVTADSAAGSPLGEDSALVYAHGENNTLMGMAQNSGQVQGMFTEQFGDESPFALVSWLPQGDSLFGALGVSGIEGVTALGIGAAAIGAAVIGVAVSGDDDDATVAESPGDTDSEGGSSEGGSGGGHTTAAPTSQQSSPATDTAAPTAQTPQTIVPPDSLTTQTVYTVKAALGPVLPTDKELTVELYREDGTKLGTTGTYNAKTGTFSYTDKSGYHGVVVARLVDPTDMVNYWDEASGKKDAPDDLLSVVVVPKGATNVNIVITPLSAIAAKEAGVSFTNGKVAGASGLAEAGITAANKNVAEAFGIKDGNVATDTPKLMVDAEGNPLSDFNEYGRALALFSGLEKNTGYTTESLVKSLADLINGKEMTEGAKGVLVSAASEANVKPEDAADQLGYVPPATTLLAMIGKDANDGKAGGSNDPGFTAASLNGIDGVDGAIAYNVDAYQAYIDDVKNADKFSSPATAAEVKAMIDAVNAARVPAAADLAASSDNGASNSDNLTNDKTPTITGTGTPGETVTILDSDGTTVLGTAVVGADGKWSIDSKALADGKHDLKVQYTDQLSNKSEIGPSISVTIETVAPTTGIDITGIEGDSGTAGDFITSDNDGLTVKATLKAALADGETVQYSNDNGATWNDIPASSITGTAISHTDTNLTSTNTIQFRVQDTAGNNGPVASQEVVIDTQAPAVGADSFDVKENQTVVGSVAATDAIGIAAAGGYSLSGADEALFTINDKGELAFKEAQDFENPKDSGKDRVYNVDVTVKDVAGNQTVKSLTVNLKYINEAPTVVSGNEIPDSTAPVGKEFTLATKDAFTDVDGDTLTYSADGLPTGFTINATSGVISGTATEAAAPANVTVTASDGEFSVSDQFTLSVASVPTASSPLDGKDNIDIQSNIVLEFTEEVTAVSGKSIRIVDVTVSGWKDDTTDTTQTISVDDATQVSVSGNKVIINPKFDLDFGSNYRVEVDAGAFTGKTSGQESIAITSADNLDFTTVTPTDTGAQSQSVKDDGTLVDTYSYVDTAGQGSSSNNPSQVEFDASGADYAFVGSLKGSNNQGYDAHVKVTNFAANTASDALTVGDILYYDNQGNDNAGFVAGAKPNTVGSDGVDTTFLVPAATGEAGPNKIELVGVNIPSDDAATWDHFTDYTDSAIIIG